MEEQDIHIVKSDNENLLLYRFVYPSKYRREVFTKEVEVSLNNICEGIG